MPCRALRSAVASCLALAATLLGPATPLPAELGATAWGACACPAYRVVNCGHRGTGTNAEENPFPENTIASAQQAEHEGAAMIEIDVLHAADGVVVVMHDDTVDRTTDGTGCSGDLTVAQLGELDAAQGTMMEGQGVKVPTLAELLAAVDVDVNVEIKVTSDAACPATDKERLATDVLAAIAADDKAREVRICSFDVEVLRAVKRADPSRHVSLNALARGALAQVVEEGFDGLQLINASVNEDVVQEAHEAGVDVITWTENDPTRMEQLIALGVDMIITDEPDLMSSTQSATCDGVTWVCDDTPGATGEAGGCATSPGPAGDVGGLASLWLLATAAVGRRRRSGRQSSSTMP